MILKEEYILKLKALKDPKFLYNFQDISSPTAYKNNYLPYSHKSKIHKGVLKIEFQSLYANIQVGLFNAGLIDQKWEEDIERVKWFLKNKRELKLLPSGEYVKWLTHCNSLYMKIKSPYVVEYMNMFYSDLIQKLGSKVIFIDADLLILDVGVDELHDICSQSVGYQYYDVTKLHYFYARHLKSYISQDIDGKIDSNNFDYDDLKRAINREIRDSKLQELLQ